MFFGEAQHGLARNCNDPNDPAQVGICATSFPSLVGIGAMLGGRCIGIGGIPLGICIDTIPGGLGDELFC